MNRWVGTVAIVTGSSSGIGCAISESLVDAGMKVVGLARRKEKLEELCRNLDGRPGKFYAFQADVTKESDILDAFRWVEENVGVVHVLVKSAGIARSGGLADGPTEHWEEVLHTNVLDLCTATREAVKMMRENRVDGHIIHINSIASHYVVKFPNINVYPATKHAVTALTESLRQELAAKNSKIKITSISPEHVRSEFLVAAQTPQELLSQMDTMPILEERDISDAVLYVLGTPPHVQVHEFIIKPIGEQL